MKKALKIGLILAVVASAVIVYAFGRSSNDSSGNTGISSPGTMNFITGKVTETMNSGGYTYINIEKDNKKTWVAIPQSEVTVGQEISVIPGMSMSNFESKTLNRTFESVVFSPGLATGSHAGSGAVSSSGSPAEKPAEEKIEVEKASGPDAYTVSELFDKKASLDSKNVVVRGKVVKVSRDIMNTNWIHIQDGSGSASGGTNDLLVTSDDVPDVGDIITVSGKLVKDRDIGSGYKFSVMIDKAEIKK